MRRQHFAWTYLVFALVITIYGSWAVFYNLGKQKEVPILGWIMFILGTTMLVVFLILLLISVIQRKKNPPQPEPKKETLEEQVLEEIKEEKEEESEVIEEVEPKETFVPRSDTEYRSTPTGTVRRSSFNGGSAYISRVGYGPVLRVTNDEILDMRSNTYYRIDDDMVKKLGSGPVFEISGNRIRDAFGGYLYEISGNNINKVFGGYYASIEGGYLQTHDLQQRYEISGHLNLAQQLAVVAILFGKY